MLRRIDLDIPITFSDDYVKKRENLAPYCKTCMVYVHYFNFIFMNSFRAPIQGWKTRHKELFCLNRKCDFL
jgi:uncharacterized membrane protein (DUF485 family)